MLKVNKGKPRNMEQLRYLNFDAFVLPEQEKLFYSTNGIAHHGSRHTAEVSPSSSSTSPATSYRARRKGDAVPVQVQHFTFVRRRTRRLCTARGSGKNRFLKQNFRRRLQLSWWCYEQGGGQTHHDNNFQFCEINRILVTSFLLVITGLKTSKSSRPLRRPL